MVYATVQLKGNLLWFTQQSVNATQSFIEEMLDYRELLLTCGVQIFLTSDCGLQKGRITV